MGMLDEEPDLIVKGDGLNRRWNFIEDPQMEDIEYEIVEEE